MVLGIPSLTGYPFHQQSHIALRAHVSNMNQSIASMFPTTAQPTKPPWSLTVSPNRQLDANIFGV